MSVETFNPCMTCGACCAHFRVSFYWAETDLSSTGVVPAHLTESLPPHRRYMKGTGAVPARCTALCGAIGETVSCTIYEQRPSVCRDFSASWANGLPEEGCDKARAAHGLPPLLPVHDFEPDNNPTTPGKPPKTA